MEGDDWSKWCQRGERGERSAQWQGAEDVVMGGAAERTVST